jgi:hypothetical protein
MLIGPPPLLFAPDLQPFCVGELGERLGCFLDRLRGRSSRWDRSAWFVAFSDAVNTEPGLAIDSANRARLFRSAAIRGLA